jgi:hypothetical protein
MLLEHIGFLCGNFISISRLKSNPIRILTPKFVDAMRHAPLDVNSNFLAASEGFLVCEVVNLIMLGMTAV